MPQNIKSPPPPGAAFAYEVAQRSLDDQLRRIEAQDAKAGILVAGAGIFAGLLFSRRYFLATAPQSVLALAGALLSVAAIAALLAFLNQRYVTAPSATAVAKFALRDEAWLKWRFLGNVHRALEWNGRKLDRKTRLLTGAQGSLIAAVVLVGGYFVWATLSD